MTINEYHPETTKYLTETTIDYRKKLGQFFTPRTLREELLSRIPKVIKPKILDPSCGTGEFLLSAKQYFVEPQLYGWEIDSKLVEIARRILPEAHIEEVDSLQKPFKEEFDIVLGNPPYFEFKPNRYLKSKFKEIISGRPNIYAFFVYLGLKILKPGGYLGYVVSSSMNNGAYFKKLRKFIVNNADIQYMKILENQPFEGVNHTFQLLVLKKIKNSGRYVFKHKDLLIFSEKSEVLKKIFEKSLTLGDLGYKVQTGKVTWSQNKDKLTNDPKEGILLIWSYNIKKGKLTLDNYKKPQYIKWPTNKADKGPAIVVRRIVGHPKQALLEAALVPPNVIFVAENHVNVIYPPSREKIEEMKEIVKQLNSLKIQNIIRSLTGNTQISKTELEKLVPITLKRKKKFGLF